MWVQMPLTASKNDVVKLSSELISYVTESMLWRGPLEDRDT
jgi:hypothetical protein